jgi:ligand-binding sensor domain-containing protein/serine phosphatase RsbU (regulator of sigma subunit)
MIKKRCVEILLFLFPVFFFAQTYPFANYGIKDGLSQSNVSGIVQDSSGFIWLATESGVSRFDGREFENYTTEDGLADNNVSTIFLDRNNNIWLGHENGSVTFYDGKNFTQLKSRLLPKDKKVFGFFQDRTGSLWISTAASGTIKIIDPSKAGDGKLRIRVYASKQGLSQLVISGVEDKKGDLWFLTDVGLKFLKKGKDVFEFFRADGLPPGQITCLVKDRNSNLLFGASSGCISRYDIETKTFEPLIGLSDIQRSNASMGLSFINTIYEDSKGFIWASLFNAGVCRFNPKTKEITYFNSTNGLGANKIKSISEDREGNILFGTLGEGMEVFVSEKFVSFSKQDGLSDNQVWAVCKDKSGKYWFGTNDGITIFNPNEKGVLAFKTLTSSEGLPSNNIRAITAAKNGDLWIGTWGGKIVKFDAQQQRFVNVPALDEIVDRYVSCLMLDKKNNLWIGTIEGIIKYDLSSGAVKPYRTIDGLSDNDITALCEDQNGNIWIGTKQKGITVFDGKKFKVLNRDQGLMYNSITSIAKDNNNKIWIGTEGGGVFVYENTKFINYRIKDGLISDFITLVGIDEKNNVWLGSNKGLNKYNNQNNTFSAYTENNGFTGVETKTKATYLDDQGCMWFGTVNGVFKYNPLKDVPNTIPPVLKLTGFKVNLEDYPISKEVTLSYQQNSLHFNFVGISLTNPAGVTYKMMLEGYDKKWKSASTQNFEIYSNLPHRNYVFKLIACNSSGACISEPFTMKITITPPFWKTWWFYLLVFGIISVTLFTYIKLREKKLKQEKKILENKVKERTAEVMRKNIELDEINQDIKASIRYAKRIQDAILPPDEYVEKHLPNTFVLFKPKDIVSGDFYWMADKEDKVVFAAVDCTGHGVPGAFMSIVGHNLLDRIIIEQDVLQPAKILDELNKAISDTLRQSDLEENTVRDGMDMALCTYHRDTSLLEYAGAYNAMWLIRAGEIIEFKADKFPIGNLKSGEIRKFTNHEVQLIKGDTVYIFSDGFCDQFGGPLGKKFKSSNFRQVLLESIHLSMEEQGKLLNDTIEAWRGVHEQVDDILVIGTRL